MLRYNQESTVMVWRPSLGPVGPALGETESDKPKERQGVGWIYWLDVARSISLWCAFIESYSPNRWIAQLLMFCRVITAQVDYIIALGKDNYMVQVDKTLYRRVSH